MAGYEQRYDGGLRELITTVFGLTIAIIGLSKSSKGGGMEELCFSDPVKKSYRKILLSDDRIVGMVLLNKTDDVGILGNIIRNRKDISPWRQEIVRTPLDMRKILLSVTRY
jgi:NAD(P)H-nitrite reductase large subunit